MHAGQRRFPPKRFRRLDAQAILIDSLPLRFQRHLPGQNLLVLACGEDFHLCSDLAEDDIHLLDSSIQCDQIILDRTPLRFEILALLIAKELVAGKLAEDLM